MVQRNAPFGLYNYSFGRKKKSPTQLALDLSLKKHKFSASKPLCRYKVKLSSEKNPPF